jgi:hypothetical protein
MATVSNAMRIEHCHVGKIGRCAQRGQRFSDDIFFETGKSSQMMDVLSGRNHIEHRFAAGQHHSVDIHEPFQSRTHQLSRLRNEPTTMRIPTIISST